MPPKKDDKRDQLRKQLEEKLLQEELARKEQEEEKLRLEEEKLQKEEEEHIRLQEAEARATQTKELEEYVHEVSAAYLNTLTKEWKLKRWNDYLHRTRELDALRLPIINAFLSEWSDDKMYDTKDVFSKVHQCLKFIEEIRSVLFSYPINDEKSVSLWNESIKNIVTAIDEKLDFMTFMLLKDAKLYLNEKTLNMEYGIKDVDSEDYQVALCLWANIHRALRRQGMAMMGFIFTLPPAMVAEDCAIRMLYSRIHHGRPEEICCPMSAVDMSEIDMKSELTPPLGDVQDPPESQEPEQSTEEETLLSVEGNDITTPADEQNDSAEKVVTKRFEEETVTEISRERQESEETLEELSPESEILTEKDEHGNMDPPEESEIKILEADEYFLVGGTYHFEIFEVPKLTTWRSGLTYIHREKPKLRRIHFKMKFTPSEETPSRTQLTDRSEDEIQRQEIPAIIQLQLQLPKYVTFLEEPIPAYFYSDLNAFSASNIYEPVYNKDNHQISFRTNKFGMFAMLQKRYSNFPYKKWQIIGGDTVILSLSGNFIKIRIEISSSGCRIESINPDEDNIAHYIGAEWAPPEQLIQKLLSVGINISAEKKISEVLGFLPKISKLENEIYITMSLLCKKCDFFWCKWNRQLPRNQVVLKFLFKDEVEEMPCSIAWIKEYRVVKVNCPDDMSTFEPDILESQSFCSNLYHLILQDSSELQKQEPFHVDCGLIENVRSLLLRCRPLSCSQ